jgi:hypothetical protein
LTKIYLILTLDCEESAKLTSDSFDRDLDWSEYWAAKLHRLICSKSRKLNRQLVELNSALCVEQNDIEKIQPMPSDAKDRIRTALQQLDDSEPH